LTPSSALVRFNTMSVKAGISFLLNPQPSDDTSQSATPASPPPTFQRLVESAQSPAAKWLSPSPLMLLSSCIAPMEKLSASKKITLPPLSLAALCEASSASSYASSTGSDGEEEAEKPVAVKAAPPAAKPKAKTGRKRVRKNRTPPCQVDGCKNIAVSRGCCVRHGGGSRCKIEGCPNRAKLYKLCFQHGGFKTCASEGCTRKSKRYGFCWSHGGGRICVIPDCSKVSTQGGLCWAHGGGNRCKLEGCTRRSYQKYGYYCVDHASLSDGKKA
jgi:hypothetical protein